MNLWLRQFLALARLTALEVIRQPICLILVTTSAALMALASVQAYQFGEDGKFARDSALAIHFFFGLVTAAYGACTALSREFKSGTVLAVLSKPVSRNTFFLSKFAGIAALIVMYSVCAACCTLLCEKASPKLYVVTWAPILLMAGSVAAAYALAGLADFFLRKPFASTAFVLLLVFLLLSVAFTAVTESRNPVVLMVEGHSQQTVIALQWHLLPAAVLVTLALLALSAGALMLATVFDTLPVMLFSVCLLFLGLISDYLFGKSAGLIGRLAHRLVPDWQLFWLTDLLTGGGTIPWSYVLQAFVYAGFIIGAFLTAGTMLFGSRETEQVHG